MLEFLSLSNQPYSCPISDRVLGVQQPLQHPGQLRYGALPGKGELDLLHEGLVRKASRVFDGGHLGRQRPRGGLDLRKAAELHGMLLTMLLSGLHAGQTFFKSPI